VLAHREADTLVVGLPDSGERLVDAIGRRGGTTATTVAPDVASATEAAARWAAPDGVVLLSPAAPSFSQFRSWRERSDAFREAARSLGAS
jgi:UDP-N-acetylmuramoylalanine--D-glutamate ligase